jgi:1,2-diacylglycerol 3-alpha-glucosyltransferase
MLSTVKRYGIEDHVFLHGPLEYKKMPEVLQDAYVFVGMGTALIEAGLLGIPGVPAIDSEGPVTYGFLYDLDGYDVGERSEGATTQPVIEMLLKLFRMSDGEYKNEEIRTRRHCERFAIDEVAKSFVGSIENLGFVKPVAADARLLVWLHLLAMGGVELRDRFWNIAVFFGKALLPNALIPIARNVNRSILRRFHGNERIDETKSRLSSKIRGNG